MRHLGTPPGKDPSKRPSELGRGKCDDAHAADASGGGATIAALAARLDVLGYRIVAAGHALLIYDTRTRWVWPAGQELVEDRASVLVDYVAGVDGASWRWQFTPASSPESSVWLLDGDTSLADVGDALLSRLRPPGEIAQVVYRSPADLGLVEPPYAIASGATEDWWTSWHSRSGWRIH